MTDLDSSIIRFPSFVSPEEDPVVITGIGIGASLGSSRESVWQGVQQGRSGMRLTTESDPVNTLRIPCAMVDWLDRDPEVLKSIQLTHHVVREALQDANIDWSTVDRERFACSISAQFGDIDYLYEPKETRDSAPQRAWWNQFLPCSVTHEVGNQYGLYGPRLCHTTACASGIVSTMAAARTIQGNQADMALCGASDAIAEMVIAAFHRMGVLSTGPTPQDACRPFDKTRSGFVMGEGSAMMVLEKRSHAINRGATIYAEFAASQALCQAHHVTGLDSEAATLTELIRRLVDRAGWSQLGPQYINAHGTGTEQNDKTELTAIRESLGSLADNVVLSSNKAILGHLINAAGSIELALTALALRDGFAPPTMHLKAPESIGNIDCLPEYGCQLELNRALKLSLAFGGHLVGMALQRCPLEAHQRQPQPLDAHARIRQPETVRRAA